MKLWIKLILVSFFALFLVNCKTGSEGILAPVDIDVEDLNSESDVTPDPEPEEEPEPDPPVEEEDPPPEEEDEVDPPPPPPNPMGDSSIRFNGNGVNDIDRIKIRIDDPNISNDQGPSIDVGATDFTIEFWIKFNPGDNPAVIGCGGGNSWIGSNLVIDRDRYGQQRAYGIGVARNTMIFGVDGTSANYTLCADTEIDDGEWHHVAFQRRFSNGEMSIYIDGVLEASVMGPLGDISYPDDGVPGGSCAGGPCINSDPFIVIGAEKHDANEVNYPPFTGNMDELRYSTVIRYESNFMPVMEKFMPDASTVGLFHFDSGEGTTAVNSATVGPIADGELRVGGDPVGPLWDLGF